VERFGVQYSGHVKKEIGRVGGRKRAKKKQEIQKAECNRSGPKKMRNKESTFKKTPCREKRWQGKKKGHTF